MDVEWALEELRRFIGLTKLRQPASGGGVVFMGDFASPVGRNADIVAAAQVVEQILDRVLPRWRTEVPDDGKERWVRHHQAANPAVAAKLRQLLPRLEAALRQQGCATSRIRIRVQATSIT